MSTELTTNGLVDGPALLEYGDRNMIPQIMTVMQNSFPETYGEAWNQHQCRSMLALPGTRLLIARIDGIICGFAFSRLVLDEEELLMIAVDPRHQKTKIGKQMLEQIIFTTTRNHGVAIFLEVRSNNNAKNLYYQFGFKEIGIRKGYYTGSDKSKYDAITFKKTLADNN